MRVLLVRAGALGDLLLLRRATFALNQAGHTVALLAPERPAAALFGSEPCEVDRLLPWESFASALLSGSPAAPVREALLEHELVVAYTRSSDLVRAIQDVGLTVQAHDPAPPDGVHAAEWLAAAVHHLAPSPVGELPSLQPTPEEMLAADRFSRALEPGFVAVHPGSGSAAKNWPRARFRALVDRLSPARPFLLVRGPADAAACGDLEEDPRAVLADELPVRVLGSVLSRVALYVGNDSGVSHLAAAFGAPTVTLFGPTDARTWRPLGARASAVSSADATMDGLSLEAVTAAAQQLLETDACGPTSGAGAPPSG